MKKLLSICLMCALTGTVLSNNGSGIKENFIVGSPEIKSIKALALGPENVLFIGDNDAMKVIAVDLGENTGAGFTSSLGVEKLDTKLADMFGAEKKDIRVQDLVVNKNTAQVFFSVSVETGNEKEYILMTLDNSGRLREYSLEDIKYSEIELKDAPSASATLWNDKSRTYTITDMAYADGELIVSGLSNEEFASSLRRIPFPFKGSFSTTGLQVYHVSHGRNETHAPVYRFLPYRLNNQMHIIAGYMCTPLVSFTVPTLKDGGKVVGKTIAELGAGNAPTGIIDYEYKGKSFVLVGNNRHPLMKFKPQDLTSAKKITAPSRSRGVSRETFKEGRIYQIADLNADYILVLNENRDDKSVHLRSIAKENL